MRERERERESDLVENDVADVLDPLSVGRVEEHDLEALGLRHQNLALEVVLPRSNNPASALIHIWKSTTLSAKFNLPHWFLVRKRGGGTSR